MADYKSRDKVYISIGTKLISIIGIIVILSLGSITALVSWMVREDLKITAEENNFESNRLSAMQAEDTFAGIRANSRLLIQTIDILGIQSEEAKTASLAFFKENPRTAALVYTHPEEDPDVLINRDFFHSRRMNSSLAGTFIKENSISLARAAAGEMLVLNATPVFKRVVLAFYFPWQGGGAGVLFSPENLVDSFGAGINQSILLNDRGDILVSSNSALLTQGTNAAEWDYFRKIQQASERNKQELLYADFQFTQLTSFGGMSERAAVDEGYTLWARYQPNFDNARIMIQDWVNNLKRSIQKDEILTIPSDHDEVQKQEGDRYYAAYTKLGFGGCIVITSIEYNKVFEGIAATTRRNIYLTFTVLFISVLLIWFFSKTISIPLKLLGEAAKNIEGGHFEQRLSLRSRDEIGMLGSSFEKMSSALRIFGRFTNREIAVKAMRGEIKPGGLPKHATIFFSDIRNFTANSENFTRLYGNEASDKLVFWLNDYLTRMVECIEKTNGAVDKFIGDAVMAHWGTAYSSGSPKQDAFNCVKAALMMRQALLAMNKERDANDPGNPRIRIGCGINTGIVTAGQIGSDLRMEYTVIGDPVNLASRVESLTKPLATDILITGDTWNLVRDYFTVEEMPPVTVKGKDEPVRLFAVVNFKSVNTSPRTLADVRSLLGLKAPDLSKIDLDIEEKKYTIGGRRR